MNPQHIDKLIVIKGLPDEWIYRTRADGKKELRPPWEADVEANIPHQVRALSEPLDVVQYFAPVEKGQPGILDSRRILGVKLNFGTEPGREMWGKVERFLDSSTPRDQKVPEPVLVAKDHKSPFETFRARKRVSGGIELEPSEVPVVDLRAKLILPHTTPATSATGTPVEPAKAPEIFKCEECDYVSEKKQAIRMHAVKRHKKEKAGTQA